MNSEHDMEQQTHGVANSDKLSTGIRGLDSILGGGLTTNRLYVIEGVPGAGKTTLALQFLRAGAMNGEPVLYVTLSETEEELRAVAASHGWDLDGVQIREVIHDYLIRQGGLEVFERLVASKSRGTPERRWLSSGMVELDRLLGGGVEGGSSTLVVGAAGTGKSTIAAKFATAAAARGEKAALFLFDESPHILLNRMDGLGIDLRRYVDEARVLLQQIDPAEMSPGEFAHRVRAAAEKDAVSLLVIDSLNGFLNAMPEERFLTIQLHELLTYLGQRGIATIMVAVQNGLIGTAMAGPVEASYLADSIIMMRYFEAAGEVRQALSVVKKRGSDHERTIREFRLGGPAGLHIGEPLRQFQGVLTGVPEFKGRNDTLLRPTMAGQ